MMELQGGYPDSPTEGDDAAYPCKGCGQVLEEGKAFELAGHRWHIDCFRCNTCGTLLDSDANLLLLGDGSLICNNCTYSCSACGNKIEDLAILTGDQAYCAGCFRCRNCKKKIENLRYARTSQGMFCMDCHDALMARRRKKTSRAPHRSKSGQNNAMLLDKSLPSLPPSAVPQGAFSPDQDALSDSYSESTPIELPASTPTGKNEGLTLPPQNRQRHSGISQRSELEDTDNGFFIPMALDPYPAPGPSPLQQQKFELDGSASKMRRSDGNSDYFGLLSGQSSRKGSYAQPPSSEESRPDSPRTTVQDQGWDGTKEASAARRRGGSTTQEKKPGHSTQPSRSQAEQNKFQLQEAPKRKKSVGSKRNSRGEPVLSPDVMSPDGKGRSGSIAGYTPLREQHVNISTNEQSPRPTSLTVPQTTSPRMSQDSRADENVAQESSKSATSELSVVPKRGDSLQKTQASIVIPRKEVGSRAASSSLAQESAAEISPSTSAVNRSLNETPKNQHHSTESPIQGGTADYPPRSRDRPTGGLAGSDPYSSPNAGARSSPEAQGKHQSKTSISSLRSGSNRGEPGSPGLGRNFRLGDEEEHGKTHDSDGHDSSFLRRVSKSVRHARSHSDRGNRNSKDGKWAKSTVNGAGETLLEDAASPALGESRDDLVWLRAELQKEREKNADSAKIQAELNAAKNELAEERKKASKLSDKNSELEGVIDGKTTIKQVNSELREKRSTMVVLDTQKEIVVRELEILTEHIAASKKSKEPLDFSNLSNSIMRDFASSLQKLKDSYTPHIEELTEKKLELQEDLSKISLAREKAQEEFRQLSAKNAQLMDMNNNLVQDLNKTGASNEGLAKHHGLGIYTHHNKDKSSVSVDSREVRPSMADSHYSGSTLAHEHDPEGATILHAPRVVNIRKEQPKKTFNWKKGGTVAKGMTKGLKGAFSSSDSRTPREVSITEGTPYGAMAQNGEPPSTTLPGGRSQQDNSRQGFGVFFGQQKKLNQPSRAFANGNMLAEEPMHPSKLFGVELESRAEFERMNIPSIVTRCIQEVELRGMDQEGIYRKSGGAAQIQVIRDGFVQNNDYDISDPDLDINAVTSCLKQYFRKLPTPLITFTVYDLLLDSINKPAEEERVQLMRSAVKELPAHHRDCLEFLVFHLARVIEREKENLMTAMNCAVVFAPTIMRPESITREMTDTAAKNTAVQFLIENCHAIFLGENGAA